MMQQSEIEMGIGDWGLGIGDWGLGQSPIPNPQSPIPNPHSKITIHFKSSILFLIIFILLNNFFKYSKSIILISLIKWITELVTSIIFSFLNFSNNFSNTST